MYILTAYNIQRAQRHIWENVELGLVQLAGQPVHHHGALLLEHIDEIVQNLKVKRRRQNLPARVPLAALAGQQSGAEPRLQEIIVATLVDVLRAAHDRLAFGRIGDEHVRHGAQPHFADALSPTPQLTDAGYACEQLFAFDERKTNENNKKKTDPVLNKILGISENAAGIPNAVKSQQ